MALTCPALPSLLTSYFNRVNNKQVLKLKNGGNIACSPMGIAGILGDGKPIVSPWGRLEDDPVEVVDSASASTNLDASTKYEDVNSVQPWPFWDQVARDYHSPPECDTNCAAAAVGGDAPAVPLLRDADGNVVPALACCAFGVPARSEGDFAISPDTDVTNIPSHRVKIASRRFPFNTLVARSARQDEPCRYTRC